MLCGWGFLFVLLFICLLFICLLFMCLPVICFAIWLTFCVVCGMICVMKIFEKRNSGFINRAVVFGLSVVLGFFALVSPIVSSGEFGVWSLQSGVGASGGSASFSGASNSAVSGNFAGDRVIVQLAGGSGFSSGGSTLSSGGSGRIGGGNSRAFGLRSGGNSFSEFGVSVVEYRSLDIGQS